ncbi:MAG: 2OG-Fe(II) oxygenase family protein [Sandaracinaceae bacterium]
MSVGLQASDMARVDLGAFLGGDASMVQRARDDLATFGFLVLENHGVPSDAIETGYDEARALFALPAPTLRRHGIGETPVGYLRRGEQALLGSQPDLKAVWHHAHQPPHGHRLRAAYPEAYPRNHDVAERPTLRSTLASLDRAFARCTASVMRLFAALLDLPEAPFIEMVDGAPHMLRLVHYPPVKRPPLGEERAVAHTGAGLFGLLPSASGPGLEVCAPDGRWQRLEPVGPDQMVVTLADQLERLSGGLLPSSLHRVRNPDGPDWRSARYAMVYFAGASPSTVLFPPDVLLRRGVRPTHPPMTAEAFTTARMQRVWRPAFSLSERAWGAARRWWRK